jgi:hypothetical protein
MEVNNLDSVVMEEVMVPEEVLELRSTADHLKIKMEKDPHSNY